MPSMGRRSVYVNPFLICFNESRNLQLLRSRTTQPSQSYESRKLVLSYLFKHDENDFATVLGQYLGPICTHANLRLCLYSRGLPSDLRGKTFKVRANKSSMSCPVCSFTDVSENTRCAPKVSIGYSRLEICACVKHAPVELFPRSYKILSIPEGRGNALEF